MKTIYTINANFYLIHIFFVWEFYPYFIEFMLDHMTYFIFYSSKFTCGWNFDKREICQTLLFVLLGGGLIFFFLMYFWCSFVTETQTDNCCQYLKKKSPVETCNFFFLVLHVPLLFLKMHDCLDLSIYSSMSQ